MNRKPVFDAVRRLIARPFTQAEVDLLDRAFDQALAPPSDHRLGALSEKYESGGAGPGTVSSGVRDPGGVSYGTYQLSSRAGTLAAFLAAEGQAWAAQFQNLAGGSVEFSRIWKVIAARDAQAFAEAQHAFIERTHYRPAVASVLARTGLDLDTRHDAVRDATWSIAVQHGRAAKILCEAVIACDAQAQRDAAGYDRALIEAMYDARTRYVSAVASGAGLSRAERGQLLAMAQRRFPAERADALAMFG